ncbi:MAG: glycosyltransferase family 39 protein [Chloroflexi bacterium]|nr:glycosyltransferase family 39 protein [Chloroflexota bacterium]
MPLKMKILNQVGTPASGVLFLFFLSIYAFTMSGRIFYGDEMEKYRVAQSIVDRGDLSFRPTQMRSWIGTDGRNYSAYELGQTVVQVPFYALGRIAQHLFPQPDVNLVTMLVVGLMNPILMALACLVLFRIGMTLGFRPWTSLLLTLAFGLGTVAWPYSRGFTREPLLTVLMLLTMYAVVRFSKTQDDRWLIAAGAAAGYLVFTKFIQGALVAVFVVYILIAILDNQRRLGAKPSRIFRAQVKGLVLFGVVALAFMAVQSLYAWLRFGTLCGGIAGSKSAPTSWISGVAAVTRPEQVAWRVLLSSEKSIFLYSPPVLLFFVSWFPWFRAKPKEALLCLGLVLVSVAGVLARFDGDGGSWWATRYLVQITPLLLIPSGVLLELAETRTRRFWTAIFALLVALGIVVSAVGAFTNDREYLDVTGNGTHLFGQVDYLRHGVFDSLLLYLSPVGWPFQVNPYAIVLLVAIVFFGTAIVGWLRRGFTPAAVSPRWALVSLVLLVELAGFGVWVVAPYAQVRAAQGNTRFVAANLLLSDGRKQEASALYLKAVDYGTFYTQQGVARIEELIPRARGEPILAADLIHQVEAAESARIEEDDETTISGHRSLRVSIPPGKDANANAMTDWIPVEPNTTYELSGWIKTVAVYGTSYAVVSLYEDDGAWKNSGKVDLVTTDETGGWSLFRRVITSKPTTRRFMVSAGLWNTYGTVWIDGVELARK